MALDRHARKAEGGILHLPNLVIHRICTFFCKHCEPPSLGEEDAPDHLTHRGQATLLNLCRVAKFHYNAQRILYHNVDIQIPNNNLQRPLEVTIGFLTSLRINPHLKNHVKSLSIQDVPWAGPGHCHVRESYDNPPLPESLLNDLRTLSHGLRITLSNVQLEKTNLVETLMQLVFISLRTSPELKLAVRPQSPWKDELFTVWKTLGDHSATLFLTQHLSLILPTMPKCSCHRRLHGLMPHQYVENMAARFLIGQAAQSLRSLACTANDLQDTPHLPQLQDLKLCIQEPAPHLASAMEQLPSLRRLSCPEILFRHSPGTENIGKQVHGSRVTADSGWTPQPEAIQDPSAPWLQSAQVMPSPDGDELCPVLLPDSLETIHINLDEISQTSDGEFEKPCMDAILHAGKKNLRMVVISSRRRRQHKFTMANLRAGPRGSRQECGWEIAEVHDDERLRLTQEEDFPAWDGC
uniref:Uncharacterized protein n=1 Tax=Bionectria ochroleuca TaxID=29856 RepID=A0A8H7TP59_BIOOC